MAILEGMVLHIQGTVTVPDSCIPVANWHGSVQTNMKLNLAWFVGFAPAYAPRVAVSVLIEGVIPQDQVQED